MKESVQGVAYLLRKTGMPLKEIRGLELSQFWQLFEEVSFQESVAEYQTAMYVGSLLAAIVNSVPRKGNKIYKAKDFINIKLPRRSTDKSDVSEHERLEALAEKFSIKLPSRELREL